MRLPDVFRKNVVFLGRIINKGSVDEFRVVGTGFFVGIPSVHTGRHFMHLVTAKHVADQFFGQPFGMRLNLKSGGTIQGSFGYGTRWWLHPETPAAVDAAVTHCRLPDEIDYGYVTPEDFFLEETCDDGDGNEISRIGTGDEVYIVGLFSKMQGNSKAIPIVRTGNVAMIPDPGERIPNIEIRNWRGDVEGYLVETRSLGGLSGSPAFVRETAHVDARQVVNNKIVDNQKVPLIGGGRVLLLGLMHGHWYIRDQDKNEVVMVAVEKDHPESSIVGISVVVPAKKILEILNHPGLVELRRGHDAEFANSMGTTSTE